jgi:hypothetical protein
MNELTRYWVGGAVASGSALVAFQVKSLFHTCPVGETVGASAEPVRFWTRARSMGVVRHRAFIQTSPVFPTGARRSRSAAGPPPKVSLFGSRITACAAVPTSSPDVAARIRPDVTVRTAPERAPIDRAP